MKPYDLLVAGEINPDLILAGNVTPELGQVEKWVDSAALTIGSSSAIFACGGAPARNRTASRGGSRRGECAAFRRRDDITQGIRGDEGNGEGISH